MPQVLKHGSRIPQWEREWRAAWNEALLKGKPVTWDTIATQYEVGTKFLDLSIIHDIPGLRKWEGTRVAHGMAHSAFAVEMETFEDTIKVFVNDIEDDNLGLYTPRFRLLGEKARIWPDQRVWDVFKTNTMLGYDGKVLFATDHPEAGSTASNVDTGGGLGYSWYLIDARSFIKPMGWGLRMAPRLDTDRTKEFSDDAIFHGVKARGAAFPAFWQLAYKSNQTINETNVDAAMIEMAKRTNDQGESLSVRPSHIVVPTAGQAAARNLFEKELVSSGESNPLFRSLQVLVEPRLD